MQSVLTKLRRDGIAVLPRRYVTEMALFRAHLYGCAAYGAHVAAKAAEPTVPMIEALHEQRWPAFSHRMEDVILAPALFEVALSLFALARDYFDGEFPYLYSMNAFWTQPVPGNVYPYTHSWHRDLDDRKQLVLFAYGTEVMKPEDGAHLYQRGTHVIEDDALGRDFRHPPPDGIETVLGGLGTMFLVDTRGHHMGIPPSGPRLLAWARWGVTCPPVSYGWDELAPVAKEKLGARYPDDPGLREAIKLVVA